jgi:hypothetical protein
MILHRLAGPPDPDLARALESFERDFTYPLGPGRSFRIEHGPDYPRFFRAVGEAASFVAAGPDGVVGTLGVAVRRLLLPDGGERPVAYLGDLKIAPRARGGMVLLRLARAAQAWAGPLAESALCVVMDGTRVTPTGYTGRAGIPAFRELGHVAVWRVPTRGDQQAGDERFLAECNAGEECYRRLSASRYASPGGVPAERSETAPTWLVHPDRLACGVVEDTRRAKRLIADDGTELRSVHLSRFAFRTAEAGAELLRVALRRGGRLGFPALFVSVAVPEADQLREVLGEAEVVVALATVYGSGLAPGPAWNINTSEI